MSVSVLVVCVAMDRYKKDIEDALPPVALSYAMEGSMRIGTRGRSYENSLRAAAWISAAFFPIELRL